MLQLFLLLSMSFATEITVATLNIGHGRGTGGHQTLQSTAKVSSNISLIADTLQQLDVDVLALQEADLDAWWSGNQNQVATLSDELSMPHVIMGGHSQKQRLAYGTSLLSTVPFTYEVSRTYRSSFPLPTKGFVFGLVELDGVEVGVASVHLDPLKPKVRSLQVDELSAVLKQHSVPLIVMGDFNMEWGDEMETYANKLGLTSFQPKDPYISFPKLNRRLDWILVNDDIEVLHYHTETTRVSDHNLVIAKLSLNTNLQ